MDIRGFREGVGMLNLATAFGVHAQGGGLPISPEQASIIKNGQAKDKQLASDVLAAVNGTISNGSRLKVRAHNGVITLRGYVPSDVQMKAAITKAKTVPGVISVKNRLHVRN